MKRQGRWVIGCGGLAAMLWVSPVAAEDQGATQGPAETPSVQPGTGGSGQQAQGTEAAKRAASAPIQKPVTMDVEELRDNIHLYDGKKVTVAGEIKDRVDARSFVIESGGIVNDEIMVVTSQKTAGLGQDKFVDDADVVVAGTVRAVPLLDVRRELSWDMDPQLEAEFEGFRYFLVADRVEKQSR